MSPRLHSRERPALTVAAAVICGLAQVVVFPRFSWDLLAPVCLVPLLLVLPGLGPWRRFLLGWLSGGVFWAGTCYWIYPVMRDYASITPPVAGALFVTFFTVKSVQMGAFAFVAGPLLRKPWAVPAVAVLWVGLEGSHQYIFFTWTQLGNASLDFAVPHVLRLAPWTGIYGPSLVFALVNVAVAVAIRRRSARPFVALVPVLGVFLLPALPPEGGGSRTARLVQPNVHPDLLKTDWLANNGTSHLARMLELSSAPADLEQPSLVVWPEYPVPAFYFDDPRSRAFHERVARESGAAFIFNTISFEDGDRQRPRNSSVTLDRTGKRLSEYSKIILVPFGEFVPWPFHYFVEKVTLQAGMFRPGKQIAVATVEGKGIGTFICYESVFARLIRKFTAGGAQLLVNISNDSWYGRSAARDQHLLVVRMRAVENARWILRATNDGVTTAIGPSGRIEAQLPSYEQAALDVRFEYRTEKTGFVRFGEWLWWLCLAAAAPVTLRARPWKRHAGSVDAGGRGR